jgi:hypothetical protein
MGGPGSAVCVAGKTEVTATQATRDKDKTNRMEMIFLCAINYPILRRLVDE